MPHRFEATYQLSAHGLAWRTYPGWIFGCRSEQTEESIITCAKFINAVMAMFARLSPINAIESLPQVPQIHLKVVTRRFHVCACAPPDAVCFPLLEAGLDDWAWFFLCHRGPHTQVQSYKLKQKIFSRFGLCFFCSTCGDDEMMRTSAMTHEPFALQTPFRFYNNDGTKFPKTWPWLLRRPAQSQLSICFVKRNRA